MIATSTSGVRSKRHIPSPADRTRTRYPAEVSMSADRRTFLKALSAGALASQLPLSIKNALAIPAHHRTGTIADVEHIVCLMQENRSFDHYFGTLRGVRGFGDPRAVKLPSGLPVWHQPDANNPDGYVLPFHPDKK